MLEVHAPELQVQQTLVTAVAQVQQTWRNSSIPGTKNSGNSSSADTTMFSVHLYYQGTTCTGSVGDPGHFGADPAPAPDPTTFFIDFKDAKKNSFIL